MLSEALDVNNNIELKKRKKKINFPTKYSDVKDKLSTRIIIPGYVDKQKDNK